MNNIVITKEDLQALSSLDEVLKKHIENSPVPQRSYSQNPFEGITSTIISQLISKKAATTIYSRLENLLEEITPENFLKHSEEDIVSCGISQKKYTYIYKIAKDFESGILDFESLKTKDSSEVVSILTAYGGIGVWSAEMILIHSFKHPDIISYGDYGIRSGICKIYGFSELSKSEFNKIKERLSPYGTIASLYFWQAHSGE